MIRRPSDAPKRAKDEPRDFDHAHNDDDGDYKDYDDDDEEDYDEDEDYKEPDTNDVRNHREDGVHHKVNVLRSHSHMTSAERGRGTGQNVIGCVSVTVPGGGG